FETELDPRETYYIVVYQTGGSEWQYYKWYYGSGDPYDRGSSYNYEGTWNEDTSKDFCFKTYGHKTGDEPDGIEERWAVIFGCVDTFMGISYYADADAYDLGDTLVSHGWDPSHIKVVISPTFNDVKNAMEWLASVDDMDDIDLVAIKSHGGKYGFAVKDMAVQYKTAMGPWLDNCGAKGIFIPINTCGSGGAIQFLAKQGRVIMTSCAEDEGSSVDLLKLKNSVFFYFLADPVGGALNKKDLDKNNNGWISAEEAFPYVSKKVPEYVNMRWGLPDHQHPQLYDGYAGELDVTKFD
ncbi:MAG: caspase family protein, partial [Thermoplasmata archaeon]|nr:caspase family protein [Thermoplasmata archaeon]